LSFGGRHLFVITLDAPEGELRVELLDGNRVLGTSAAIKGSRMRLRVEWPTCSWIPKR